MPYFSTPLSENDPIFSREANNLAAVPPIAKTSFNQKLAVSVKLKRDENNVPILVAQAQLVQIDNDGFAVIATGTKPALGIAVFGNASSRYPVEGSRDDAPTLYDNGNIAITLVDMVLTVKANGAIVAGTPVVQTAAIDSTTVPQIHRPIWKALASTPEAYPHGIALNNAANGELFNVLVRLRF